MMLKLYAGMFGVVGQRRFHALIATPLFLMSCLSNFYFFAGKQVMDKNSNFLLIARLISVN